MRNDLPATGEMGANKNNGETGIILKYSRDFSFALVNVGKTNKTWRTENIDNVRLVRSR